MKAKHIFENQIYLLSNLSVARNPLFKDEYYVNKFKGSCTKYLSSICEIISISCKHNQWEMIARMRSRIAFEEFYRLKHGDFQIPRYLIPESGYIFSQQMANLQSGFVKHYNWINNRIGTLFYRRYSKYLITNEQELNTNICRLGSEHFENAHKGYWALGSMGISDYKGSVEMDRVLKNKVLELFLNRQNDLAVRLSILPRLKITDPIPRYLRTIFKILHSLSN